MNREEYFLSPKYTRGRVCKLLNITKDTLRYYEDAGIIHPYTNPTNNYKYYSIADIEILEVILFLRSIDVSVPDIPKVMECKEIDSYENFLENQMNVIQEKIVYWQKIENVIIYLRKIMNDYQKYPNQVKEVSDVKFCYRVSKFVEENEKIEDMLPSVAMGNAVYHILKLKIVGNRWIESDREDKSDLLVGHLCEEEDESVCVNVLKKALMKTTFGLQSQLPQTIKELKEEYKDVYEFEDQVYIMEHLCINIYTQDALIRSIFLPIKEK